MLLAGESLSRVVSGISSVSGASGSAFGFSEKACRYSRWCWYFCWMARNESLGRPRAILSNSACTVLAAVELAVMAMVLKVRSSGNDTRTINGTDDTRAICAERFDTSSRLPLTISARLANRIEAGKPESSPEPLSLPEPAVVVGDGSGGEPLLAPVVVLVVVVPAEGDTVRVLRDRSSSLAWRLSPPSSSSCTLLTLLASERSTERRRERSAFLTSEPLLSPTDLRNERNMAGRWGHYAAVLDGEDGGA